MAALLRYVAWRHLQRVALRTLLVLVSVALAVGMLVCVQETVGSAAATLTRAVEDTAGRAQLQVVGQDETGLDESLLEAVRSVPGVARAVPVIAVHAHLAGAPGRRLFVTGIDLLDGAALDFYDADLHGDGIEDSLVFLAKADSIAISKAFAAQNRLALGDRVPLLTSQGRRDFVVRGLFGSGTRGLGVGGDVGLMDLYAAQRAFGREHRLDRIDLALAPDADVERTAAALRVALGEAAVPERPATRGAAVDHMLASFRLMTAFLGLIALVAAAFLVFSVTTIAVAQRRHEIAVLRALGATRRQAVVLFVSEAALVGVLASSAGVGAGTWAARMLPRALSWLVEATFQAKLDLAPPALRPAALAGYFAVGLGAIVAASLLAAPHAARVPVVAALRALPAADDEARSRRRRLAAAAALCALSLAAVATQSRMRVFLVGGTADLLMLLAALLATPSLIAVVAPRLIDVAGHILGTPAQLALRNVARQGERLAAPVVVLTIGLHLLITVGVIAGSFERSVLGWLARGSVLDLVVTSSGTYSERRFVPLDEDFAEALRAVPGVAEVRPLRENHVRFRGAEIGVRAWAIGAHPSERDLQRFDFLEGNARAALAEVAAGKAALVSQNLAAHFRLGAGDAIELPTPSGAARFTIAGVVMDYFSQAGTVIVEREAYRRLWGDRLVDGFGVGLAAGTSAADTRERIAERLGARFDLVVLTMADYLAETRALIHRAFFPLRAIEAVTLVIGLLTLLNALLVSVAERFRELGILRASGASSGQLVRMILGEAVATGSIAALLGIAIGLYGSQSWIRVHIPIATGWIVSYVFPFAATVLAVAGALALAALAALYPGRLAARLPIVAALRSD